MSVPMKLLTTFAPWQKLYTIKYLELEHDVGKLEVLYVDG
jgi:hypothetical protein